MTNTVLITGASSGIGAALAQVYARAGHDVALVARRENKLLEVGKRCQEERPGTKIYILVADVTDDAFETKLTDFMATLPHLDVVIANAGAGCAGKFDKLKQNEFDHHFATNIGGVLKTVRAGMPFLRQNHGRVVLLGSLNSYLAFPMGSPYSMGKFAIRALAESLYCETPTTGVEVTLVNPGPVKTEIFTLNNHGQPVGDVELPIRGALSALVAAERIRRGASKGKRELFLKWSEAFVIGIHRHFPCLSLWLTREVYKRYHPKFAQMVGQINPDSV